MTIRTPNNSYYVSGASGGQNHTLPFGADRFEDDDLFVYVWNTSTEAWDKKTVTTISYLSRLQIDGKKEEKIIQDLDNIIKFVDQLDDVDTSNIEPLTNPLEKTAKTRTDEVTAKNLKDELLEIAPSSNEDYFLVPRVVE